MKRGDTAAIRKIVRFLTIIGFPVDRFATQTAISLYAMLDRRVRHGLLAGKRCLNEGARIHDLMNFARRDLKKRVAENTRESYRKGSIKPLLDAGLITIHRRSVNDPNTTYALNRSFESLLREYLDTTDGDSAERIARSWNPRRLHPTEDEAPETRLQIEGETFVLSRGPHNRLIRNIVVNFAPIFLGDSRIIYLSDAERKMKYVGPEASRLKLALDRHEKLPDVILFAPASNILYLVEAVTSSGPMDEARVKDLRDTVLPQILTCGVEYFTAFQDRRAFRGCVEQIAWGTQVWISDEPTGVITFRKVR